MIRLFNVNKNYIIKDGVVNALRNINIEFPNSGFYSILGKSGSGKTTLLNCLAGIDKVTSGSIFYNDIDITKLNNSKLDDYREEVSFIFQDYNLLNEYSVEDNIALAIKIQGLTKLEIKEIVNDALNKVGLSGYNNRRISELSGGQQQRVVIARALAKNSKVVFCDEPTGNLDEGTSRELFQILKELSKEILVIAVTHNNSLANDYSDGIVQLEEGTVASNNININNENNDVINDKKKKTINSSFYFRLSFEQIKALKTFSIFILLLFICSFSIFTIFDSISKFDTTEALINTLKNNNQTVVGLRTYRDYVIEKQDEGGKEYEYGISTDYLQDTVAETEQLKIKIGDKASIYNSYIYIRSFSSLFNIDYPFEKNYNGDDFVFHYHAFNFNAMIAVDDFDNFSMPLLYGKYPKRNTEILIYDYMAENLIYHKAFSGKVKDILGKKIIDKAQDLDLEIVGIIKSNYQEYEYIDEMKVSNSQMGLVYLNSLKSIYVKKELIDKMNKNCRAFNEISIKKTDTNEENISLSNIQKIEYVDVDFDFLYKTKEEMEYGVIYTLSQVKEILGLDRLPTEDEINDFASKMEKWTWSLNYCSYSNASYNSFYSVYPDTFLGIVNDNAFNDNNTLHVNYSDIYNDGAINEVVYLSLNKDFSNAKEVLDMLQYPKRSEQYYENCIKEKNFYDVTGFCVYDTSQILIDEASEYLYEISDICETASILCYCFILIGIIAFCLLSIKKQTYKIGILKSLGAKNIQIGCSFVLAILTISLIATVVSIPISYISMGLINTKFINEVENVSLIMFKINPLGLMIPFIITLGIIVLTSLITYISFTINPPVQLIRYNKER